MLKLPLLATLADKYAEEAVKYSLVYKSSYVIYH